MKGLGSNITKGISKGSIIECTDNSGAKILRVSDVINYKGTRKRHPKAGVGDVVKVSVRKGSPEMRQEVPIAVIVRQKKEWRRPDGRRVKFDDNAAVLINERDEPRANEVSGAVAKEAVERFPEIGKISRIIV